MDLDERDIIGNKSGLDPEGNVERVIAFTGGKILTMDPIMRDAEVLIIKEGRIEKVGRKELLRSYPDAHMIDLDGQALLPSFIDSHNHLSFACFLPIWADLDGLTRKSAVLEALSDHTKMMHRKWVVGFPWSDVEDGGEPLTKSDLDSICPDRPVALIHGTFHKLLLNSKALEIARIERKRMDTVGNEIIRGPDGEPNGVICERAEIPILEMALSIRIEEYADLIEKRARTFLAYGITAIQDPGVTPDAEKAYRLLHEQGRLPVSVLMMPHGRTLLDNDISARLEGPITGTGDESLRIGPIKLFADGGINGTIANAGMIFGKPFVSGSPRDDFAQSLIEAVRRGFQVCVHSIGNKATDVVLDAFENAKEVAPPGFDLRPRIEHMFILSEEQIDRLAKNGACASIQPFFFQRIISKKVPCFEGSKWFPIGDMVKAGITVCANSDDPGFGSYSCINPVQGALLGTEMSDSNSPLFYPNQSIPFEKWLSMYTSGAALAGGLENERGMLKEGLVADLVILSSAEPDKLPEINETWKAGKMVFRRNI